MLLLSAFGTHVDLQYTEQVAHFGCSVYCKDHMTGGFTSICGQDQ